MSEAVVNAIIAGIGSADNATEQAIQIIENLDRAGFGDRAWQPIETAPQQQVVDLWAVHESGRISTRVPCAFLDCGKWIDGNGRPLPTPRWRLTHWMPIPKGPTP